MSYPPTAVMIAAYAAITTVCDAARTAVERCEELRAAQDAAQAIANLAQTACATSQPDIHGYVASTAAYAADASRQERRRQLLLVLRVLFSEPDGL